MEITKDKVTELFCIIDEFYKVFDAENAGKLFLSEDGVKRRRRKASLSDSEIMTILLYFHFGSFRNFKHYYLFFIRGTLKSYFPNAVSYNRFVELESRVFFPLMFFLNLRAFGRCTGITFVDSTMIPICHNLRRYANKVFKGIATDGKGTMGWCHGFKLHLACNDRGEIIAFVLTGANVSDKDPAVFDVLAKRLYDIIGIVLGVAASLLKIDFPEIIDKTLASLAKMASPLALITIGAGFEGRKAIAKIKPTIAATMIKLVVLPAVFLPIAIKLGFRDQALVALIIMLGSPTTPSSYIMAKNMGHEGVLTSSVVVATTLMSSLCLTFWIFVARYFGYII